jgi:hypothetical protein
MKKKMLKGALALIMVVGVVIPTSGAVHAIHVGNGVQWTWGLTPWSVWSTTTNYPRGVYQVQSRVGVRGQLFYSYWDPTYASIDVGYAGWGRTANYDTWDWQ